jgi:hypothetical protein
MDCAYTLVGTKFIFDLTEPRLRLARRSDLVVPWYIRVHIENYIFQYIYQLVSFHRPHGNTLPANTMAYSNPPTLS